MLKLEDFNSHKIVSKNLMSVEGGADGNSSADDDCCGTQTTKTKSLLGIWTTTTNDWDDEGCC